MINRALCIDKIYPRHKQTPRKMYFLTNRSGAGLFSLLLAFAMIVVGIKVAAQNRALPFEPDLIKNLVDETEEWTLDLPKYYKISYFNNPRKSPTFSIRTTASFSVSGYLDQVFHVKIDNFSESYFDSSIFEGKVIRHFKKYKYLLPCNNKIEELVSETSYKYVHKLKGLEVFQKIVDTITTLESPDLLAAMNKPTTLSADTIIDLYAYRTTRRKIIITTTSYRYDRRGLLFEMHKEVTTHSDEKKMQTVTEVNKYKYIRFNGLILPAKITNMRTNENEEEVLRYRYTGTDSLVNYKIERKNTIGISSGKKGDMKSYTDSIFFGTLLIDGSRVSMWQKVGQRDSTYEFTEFTYGKDNRITRKFHHYGENYGDDYVYNAFYQQPTTLVDIEDSKSMYYGKHLQFEIVNAPGYITINCIPIKTPKVMYPLCMTINELKIISNIRY